ncbi:MAG TPA: DUF2207 domain-containing protein [Gaiellaceae bacterium]
MLRLVRPAAVLRRRGHDLGHSRRGIVVGLLALALPASAAAKLTETSARAVFTLDSDGVLEVLERLSVKADQPTPTTWQITMHRGELFAQPSLVVDGRRYRPGDGRRPGTFRISRGTRGIRFDWLQPGGAHAVRLGYRLALFGTAYTDVVDLRVPVWEGDWPVPVRDFTAALHLPRVPHGRIIVWAEPRSQETTITTSRTHISLAARNVDAETAMTLHAVLPRDLLTSVDGVKVEPKPGLAAILDERGDDRSWWPWTLAAVAAIALSAVAFRTARSRLPLRR